MNVNEGGHKHEDDAEDGFNKEVEMNGGLICVGILGIRDVIRPEVPHAVEVCQKAGIRVRMVTGDNKVTALAIARECKIISEDHEDAVMEGPEFYRRVGGLFARIVTKIRLVNVKKRTSKKLSRTKKNSSKFMKS